MSIAARYSFGVFAECPHCHQSIQHGFQVCAHCGHTVSAAEQQQLRNLLRKNVARHLLAFIATLAAALAVLHMLSQ